MRYFDEIEEAEFEGGYEPESDGPAFEFEREESRQVPKRRTVVHPQLGLGQVMQSEMEFENGQEEQELLGKADSRFPIRDTTKIPYRFICRLEMIYQDPSVYGGAPTKFAGSGTLISPRHVLTAAHNVRTRHGAKILNAQSVTASPGQNRGNQPFGVAKVTGFKAKNEWVNQRNWCHDYAILTLERDIGAETFKVIGNRALGHWGDFADGNNTRLEFVEPAKLKNIKLLMSGYPGDKCGYLPLVKYRSGGICRYDIPAAGVDAELATCINTGLAATAQFGAKGRMVDPLPQAGGSFLFLHDMDTCGGHSGSPVWTENGGLRYLLGIHTGPWSGNRSTCMNPEPAGVARDSNRAVRVTTGMLDNIRKWKQ